MSTASTKASRLPVSQVCVLACISPLLNSPCPVHGPPLHGKPDVVTDYESAHDIMQASRWTCMAALAGSTRPAAA